MTEEQLTKLIAQRESELQNILNNPRAGGVVVIMSEGGCLAARTIQGTYPKDAAQIPDLPLESCSQPGSCQCRYEPFIGEVGP